MFSCCGVENVVPKQFGKRHDVLGYLRGKKGIVFTCPQGKEKDARREALNVLSSIIEDDDVDDKKVESEKKSDGADAADELAAELRAMRDSEKKEKFKKRLILEFKERYL